MDIKTGNGVFYAKDETGKVTAYMVDKGSEGYTWSKPWSLMGLAGQGLVVRFS